MGSNKLNTTIDKIIKEYFSNSKRPLLEIIEGQISIFDLLTKNDLKNCSTKSIDILNKKSKGEKNE